MRRIAGKGEVSRGLLPEVRGELCGYGAEDTDLPGGGRAAAGGAVHTVQGYHPAHSDPEDHQPVQLSGIRLVVAAVPVLWGGSGIFQVEKWIINSQKQFVYGCTK